MDKKVVFTKLAGAGLSTGTGLWLWKGIVIPSGFSRKDGL